MAGIAVDIVTALKSNTQEKGLRLRWGLQAAAVYGEVKDIVAGRL